MTFTIVFPWVMIVLGALGTYGIATELRSDRGIGRLVPHCPRCDGMREFGHRCPDAKVPVDR